MSTENATKSAKNYRIKYDLDAAKVVKAMKAVGADAYSKLKPDSKAGPAKDIADKLGMDGNDRNVRRGVDRFIQREFR